MPVPVISISQMREWENATWATGQTEGEVIRRVGHALAQCALEQTQPGDLILILAGKGNNGADARACREHLRDRRVDFLEVTDPVAALPKLDGLLCLGPRLVIDGLFGIGLDRPLSAEWIQCIERVNQARFDTLSVDVPSGLDADTGNHYGVAIQASTTLTVGAPKIGMLQESAWDYVGRLEVAASVGLGEQPSGSELLWTLPTDFVGFPPTRRAATHKGTYGHLTILAGSLGYHGAAVLAARAAQRAQPGLITLFTLEQAYHSVASQLQAVMVSPLRAENDMPKATTAFLAGPGLAAPEAAVTAKSLVRHLWRDSDLPVIIDASALDWIPLGACPRDTVRVLTPHPGEAGRLLATSVQQIQSNRPRALRAISKRFGDCWVVLKGHQTLIGRSTGPLCVNSSGNPHLAQGGSGDVLSGFIAGLLAQPRLRADPFRCVRYAVWQHGTAADHLQARRPNWVVEDLVESLATTPARS
jgi:ADP-dependent NAD(P)H-hydrate dehydratase / NAD(P)H-hydrate epimerase